MAETVHLFLKANGTDVKGESTQTSLGREGSIECVMYKDSVITARETGSGLATGRRQYEPITIRKRLDKSTPLIFKALTENQVVEGELKFYRPNPTGDGTTEQFFTIAFKQGRVQSIKRTSPDCLEPTSTNAPPLEEIMFVFHTISVTYTDGGVQHEDTWSAPR